jgi:glyoxylase-like metal-dependent hydrolase (beta-lactamase superfamily II)
MSSLIPGQPSLVAPGVWRVLALNPGMMTGPGTNSYLLASDQGLVLLDPGPVDAHHADSLRAAAAEIGQPITCVLVTHTHRDHSPNATQFEAVRRLGPLPPDDGLQDEAWQPDQVLADGDCLSLGEGRTLRVIATPGHVSNHLCYLLEEEGVLFSGDHLIQGSTVVIAPPSGSMADYLASLRKLEHESILVMAPGHGDLIVEPMDYIRHTIGHRLRREEKVVRALTQHPDSQVSELVPSVYDDVPVFLHGVATMSLLAHLLKLEQEQRARRDADERWVLS